ncbi:hypothetical protein CPB84DRAFT_1822338 [Gymnopilus junonius]|uniref:Uncharacterized protein n=1 Tax=Gymnopilus junonius TaxID=109634 RepID=A0A9P5NXK3_GYMJU|nr:hypothetical protein CPB84DRAFT_1822338 [Gymnopilus junonius]
MDTPTAGGPQHLHEPKEQQYPEGSALHHGEAEPHSKIISYRTFITGNSTSSENDYIEQERSNGKSSDGSSPQETGSVGSERLAQPPEIHLSSEGSAINQEVEVEVEASEIGSKRKHNAETGSEAPAQPQQPSKRARASLPSSSSSASTSSDTPVPAKEGVQKRKRAPKTPKTLKKNIGGVFRQQMDPSPPTFQQKGADKITVLEIVIGKALLQERSISPHHDAFPNASPIPINHGLHKAAGRIRQLLSACVAPNTTLRARKTTTQARPEQPPAAAAAAAPAASIVFSSSLTTACQQRGVRIDAVVRVTVGVYVHGMANGLGVERAALDEKDKVKKEEQRKGNHGMRGRMEKVEREAEMPALLVETERICDWEKARERRKTRCLWKERCMNLSKRHFALEAFTAALFGREGDASRGGGADVGHACKAERTVPEIAEGWTSGGCSLWKPRSRRRMADEALKRRNKLDRNVLVVAKKEEF